jgi:hypothetical protein
VEDKPLTPKEIGYLSPRVPRPVYVEKPAKEEQSDQDMLNKKEITEVKEHETKEVLLENGERVLIKVSNFTLENGSFDKATKTLAPLEVTIGQRFRVEDEDFIFAGVVEDKRSSYNGQPVGYFASGEKLHRVFDPEQLDFGILKEFRYSLEKDSEKLGKEVEDFCQLENYLTSDSSF